MAGPFAQWPDEIRFTTAEVETLLSALEVAADGLVGDPILRSLRRAQLVIWRRLWPELAEQYEEPEAEEEA